MRKTNTYFKRRRFLRNMIIFAIVQVALIMIACMGFDGRQKATSDNTTAVTFFPDEVISKKSIGIGRFSRSDISIVIIHNSIKYFYEDECDGWQFREDLLEELSKEELHISYMTESHRIVDIRSATKVYYTIGDYNSEQIRQIVMGCIVLSFVELVFLCAVILYVAIAGSACKVFRRKRKTGKDTPS